MRIFLVFIAYLFFIESYSQDKILVVSKNPVSSSGSKTDTAFLSSRIDEKVDKETGKSIVDTIDYNSSGRKDYFFPSTNWNKSFNLPLFSYAYDTLSPKQISILIGPGDSRLRIRQQLIQKVKNEYALSSEGFSCIGDNGTQNSDSYSDYTKCTRTNVTFNVNSNYAPAWGIAGSSVILTSTSTVNIKTAPYSSNSIDTMTASSIEIFYRVYPGGGTFRYRLNGGSYTSVVTNSMSDSLSWLTIVNPDTTYCSLMNIDIEGVSDSSYIYGYRTLNRFKSGIILDYIARGGSMLKQWLTYNKYWIAFVKHIQPAQIHSQIGINDPDNSVGDSISKKHIRLITLLRSNLPAYSDIIFYTNYQRGLDVFPYNQISPANWYYKMGRDTVIAISKRYNCSYVDLYEYFPNRSNGALLGLWKDGIHLTTSGNALFSNAMMTAIGGNITADNAKLNQTNIFKAKNYNNRGISVDMYKGIGFSYLQTGYKSWYRDYANLAINTSGDLAITRPFRTDTLFKVWDTISISLPRSAMSLVNTGVATPLKPVRPSPGIVFGANLHNTTTHASDSKFVELYLTGTSGTATRFSLNCDYNSTFLGGTRTNIWKSYYNIAFETALPYHCIMDLTTTPSYGFYREPLTGSTNGARIHVSPADEWWAKIYNGSASRVHRFGVYSTGVPLTEKGLFHIFYSPDLDVTQFPVMTFSGLYGGIADSCKVGINKAGNAPNYTLDVNGTTNSNAFRVTTLQTAPASATDTGTAGEIRFTATGVYICIATNSWIKCVGASW